MCPVCIATAAMIAGKATSSTGLAAVAIKKFGSKNAATTNRTRTTPKEDRHV